MPTSTQSPAEQLEQDGNAGDTLSRPKLSQAQINAQLNKRTPSVLSECPVCGRKFQRAQERDRHLKSYLPHSIYCPSQGCPWTGRRRWDLKTHWERKHSETGQVLGREKNRIYDPKEFVKLIANGTSHVQVAESAFSKAKERLKILGKVDVGVNVLGRKLEIDSEIERD